MEIVAERGRKGLKRVPENLDEKVILLGWVSLRGLKNRPGRAVQPRAVPPPAERPPPRAQRTLVTPHSRRGCGGGGDSTLGVPRG